MTYEEAKLRMEIAAKGIQNPSLQVFVLTVLSKLPLTFWQREASRKHHHPDEQAEGGNVLHQLRVAALADLMAEVCNLKQLDRDLLRAAALLHDCCRHGLDGTEQYTVKDHANLVREFIERQGLKSVWTNSVCEIIETHMSRWGVPPYTPQISPRDILILADYVASQPSVEVRG